MIRNAVRSLAHNLRVELGPPSYAILDLEGREISDRWAQTLVLRSLAERLFNEAVRWQGSVSSMEERRRSRVAAHRHEAKGADDAGGDSLLRPSLVLGTDSVLRPARSGRRRIRG